MSTIYKVFVPTTKAVVSEHTDVKEANKACVEFNKENGGIAIVMMAEVDEPAPTAEKIYTYTNNTHCPGNRAKIKVESHKYPNETHNGHSVWVEYYFDERQLKSCFRHSNYMDAEKFYKKVGRSWVEFNFNPIANEKAICEKAEKIENIVERLKAKKEANRCEA